MSNRVPVPASSSAARAPLQILDLRHFSAPALRPLLEEETGEWSRRLRWDYRASAKLLLDYLDSHILPGYVASEDGRVVGYVFCVYEHNKAVIGDVFGSDRGSAGGSAVDRKRVSGGKAPRDSDTATQIETRLLIHLLELLQNSPGVERIETQLLLHPHGQHAPLFEKAGFSIHERLFMELKLNGTGSEPAEVSVPKELELRTWRDSDFAAAGRLISHSYREHLDSLINDQYRTVGGSLRFLHNIVRFPGCGFFDGDSSLVLAYRDRDELAGVLLCSRVSDDTGHVTQICLSPALRHRGLGRLLMVRCFGRLREAGLDSVTLTVTKGNTEAVALYEERGFHVRHTFDAMVWERARR